MSNSCFHCGDDIPSGVDITLNRENDQEQGVGGEPLRFCCNGCKAVYQTICSGGFDQYYQQRTELAQSQRPLKQSLGAWQQHELEQSFGDALLNQLDYVSEDNNKIRPSFCIEGMRCSACAWLIESALKQIPGVHQVNVTLFNQKLSVQVDSDLQFETVIQSLADLGYQVLPWSEDARAETMLREKQSFQRRMGVSGLIMMQVGMLALAMYLSAGSMSVETLWLLRGASALLATVAIGYCAAPILRSAWFAVRQLHLNMDVPISIALLSAYGMSLAGTAYQWHEVYFDTVCMFVFFVLLSRFFEVATRSRAALASQQSLPQTSLRRSEFDESEQPLLETVAVSELAKGDVIFVERNATVAADGVLVEGDVLGASNSCEINESVFSGESEPIKKNVGSRIFAGTINTSCAFWLEVLTPVAESRIAQLARLAEQAQSRKPVFLQQIDRVVPWFIAGVLLLALSTFFYWLFHFSSADAGAQIMLPGQSTWLSSWLPAWKVALSVLVVSCPCALALATPMGHALGNLASKRLGVTTFSENLLPRLSDISDVIFDKTGTLTQLNAKAVDLQWINKELIDKDGLLKLIYLIEQDIDHPIAQALVKYAEESKAPLDSQNINTPTSRQFVNGCGIEAVIDGTVYRLGAPDWAVKIVSKQKAVEIDDAAFRQSRSLLCSQEACLAALDFGEALSDGAVELCHALADKGIHLHLVSGDRQGKTFAIAEQLGIDNVKAACLPEDKLNYLGELQANDKKVLVVGDGVNDAPVFSAADASIAVLGASSISQLQADAALTTKTLLPLLSLLKLSNSTRRIVRQNIFWAITYNSISLPIAAMGLLPAWAAALGMSLSSLLVVANAHRLLITKDQKSGEQYHSSALSDKQDGLNTSVLPAGVR